MRRSTELFWKIQSECTSVQSIPRFDDGPTKARADQLILYTFRSNRYLKRYIPVVQIQAEKGLKIGFLVVTHFLSLFLFAWSEIKSNLNTQISKQVLSFLFHVKLHRIDFISTPRSAQMECRLRIRRLSLLSTCPRYQFFACSRRALFTMLRLRVVGVTIFRSKTNFHLCSRHLALLVPT